MTDSLSLSFPLPQRPRWQPLRLGLVDVFHYDDEEIWLRDGNLLLRGNNGTGKSKVLALTLPFLLDGQMAPSRVEPDGDPGKRMEWNLLLGGQYQERRGYVWLEFGRDLDGVPEYCTLGCGMRAVAGRSALERWFFVTALRVRQDLWLLDANRRTLTRDRLLEALGSDGELFTSAAQYRDRVDQRLFRLGRHRYEALINLMIQLRQPQLSKRPDERALSSALTEALPPLDQAVLNDVADAFRNLEEERKTLDGLNEARASVGDFLVHYRRYCAVAARRRTETLRQAQSAWDKVSAELRETADQLMTARDTHERERKRQEFLNLKLAQGRTHLQTLRDSPEMRDASRLRDAASLAAERTQSVRSMSATLDRLDRDIGRHEARINAERCACADGAERVRRLTRDWRGPALDAGIATMHERSLEPLTLPDGGQGPVDSADPAIDAAKRKIDEQVQRRRAGIERLGTLNRDLSQALQREQRDRERRQAAQDETGRLDQDRAMAAQAITDESTALASGLRKVLESNRELRIDDPEELLAELSDWCETLAGDNPVQHRLHATYSTARDRLTNLRGQARQARTEAEIQADALRDERRRIEAGELAMPPPPYARAKELRRGRPGAPLWQLVDFDDRLGDSERAALEAALESSGLLDAWVLPNGELRDAETWDCLLTSIEPAAAGLDRVLETAIDPRDPAASRIDAETVTGILAGIGWGEQTHPAWVAADGRWRLGPAQGAWGKPEPAYIGHAAREAARRRRLQDIADALAELDELILTLSEQIETIDLRRERLDREWHSLPADRDLRAAHQRHDDLRERLARMQSEVERLTQILAKSRAAAEQCRDARDKTALDLDLPAESDALSTVALALARYETDAAGFWPTLRHHWDRIGQLRDLTAQLTELAERRAEQREELDQARARQREAEEICHTLRETVGERVDQLQRRIEEAEGRIADLEVERKDNEDKLVDAVSCVGRLDERHKRLTTALSERDRERRTAVDTLAHFSATGLLRIAAPDVEVAERDRPWPIDPTVRLARRMEQALADVTHDDNAWRRQQQGLHDRFQPLQQTLSRYGHSASVEQDGELLLVRVLFQARPCGPDELATSLDTEVAERKALLDAKERELLEEHLMSDVATHLQQLIGDGERMVGRINRELEERPTSTGMKLRLAWVALDEDAGKAPVGLGEARKRLLRQTIDAWSDDDRRAVGEFLQRRIDDVRQSDDAGTLIEHLEGALDYRRWHRFTVERWQGGKWRPAYGPASGGERALVVTLPLFAAASSHYSSASPEAPRLVMLDEAFAGIDDDSRAKCLGLMAQFDLDFVLTSEREWGCYAAVPGLAIVQLVRHEGIDAVYLSRWTWDGHKRHIAEPPPLPPMPSPLSDDPTPAADPDVGPDAAQQDLF